jgi:hypothetical protein
MPSRRSLVLSPSSSATPEEAAAIVAAIERFVRASASSHRQFPPAPADGWRATAMLEGVSREPSAVVAHPWLGGAQ